MKIKLVLSFLLLFATSLFSLSSFALVDDDARIVHLRKGCLENGMEIANCFTKMKTLQDWVDNIRLKDAGNLLVDIGPGQFRNGFSGVFDCTNLSNITLRGSGPGKTLLGGSKIITVDGVEYFLDAPLSAIRGNGCFNLHVQDLTLDAGFITIRWEGNGNSTWTNVELNAGLYGWSEQCTSVTKRPVHRWFSSRLVSPGRNTKTIYLATCSENWFIGSEFENRGNGSVAGVRAITAHGGFGIPVEVHIYGSVIRVISEMTEQLPIPNGDGDAAGVIAVSSSADSEVHIHGTGIDVIANVNQPNGVAAFGVANGGSIHAAQSAFVLQNGSGNPIYRLKNDGGIIKSPYLWESDVLTLGNSFISEDGADQTTEVICADTGGGQVCMPHTLVYTSQCATNGPWFDTVANACRQ